jgi:translin
MGEKQLAKIKQILANLLPELEEKIKLREDTITVSRRVTVLSKQAVMAIHSKDFEDASSKLDEARRILKDLEDRFVMHPDLRREPTNIAYQEYAEGRVFEVITSGLDYPSPSDLKIPTISYVLGLADAVGEFRRSAVEALTHGELQEAESSLHRMEEIYNELLPLEFFYSLAPELRRKVDVARHLIEATMGDICTEARRDSLESVMRSLEKKLEGKRL